MLRLDKCYLDVKEVGWFLYLHFSGWERLCLGSPPPSPHILKIVVLTGYTTPIPLPSPQQNEPMFFAQTSELSCCCLVPTSLGPACWLPAETLLLTHPQPRISRAAHLFLSCGVPLPPAITDAHSHLSDFRDRSHLAYLGPQHHSV